MTSTNTNRISLRLTTEELERITYAAKLKGKSLRQFIIDSAREAAEVILLKVPSSGECQGTLNN